MGAQDVRAAERRGIPAALIAVLCTHLSVDASELTLDANLAQDLGADSLDVIEIQMALEHVYGVSAEDDWIDEDILPGLTVLAVIEDLRRLGAQL